MRVAISCKGLFIFFC